MTFLPPIRAAMLATTLALPAFGQAIPPTAPTLPVPAPAVQENATPASQAARRATVLFTRDLLSVVADNSSLNQILREIGRLTGMKITGGVNEERVYGTYGPADTSTVLSALLRGTGSNMLLIFDPRQSPRELVLTPRGGGATPPSPSASRDRDEDDLPPQRRAHIPTAAESNPGKPIPEAMPMPAPEQPMAQPAPATTPAGDTTTQSNPNGVPTPQQIYEQLMKLQQKTAVQAPPH